MEPRSCVVDPTGEQITIYAATQVPHILRTMTAATMGLPEAKIRVIAPDVGGGFGGKIAVLPEEMLCLAIAQKLGKPVKWTETRSESLLAAHHGRDQIQDLVLTAKKDGTLTGFDVHLYADMGAYIGLVGPGVPILGAFMFNAIYKIPALEVHVHDRLHHQDAHRRLPRRRPSRGHVRDRADDGRARRRARPRPDGAARAELDQARGVPVHHGRGPHLRLGQLRAGHRAGHVHVRLRGPAPRAGGAARERRPGPARHRHLDVHRDVRARPVAAAGLARPTARAAGRPRRSGCWPPARSRSSPARPRTGRGTRRRSARSSPTSSACRSRTSRSCTATPRSRRRASTPTARGRWSSAASRSSTRRRR